VVLNPLLKEQASREGLKGLNANIKLFDVNYQEEKQKKTK